MKPGSLLLISLLCLVSMSCSEDEPLIQASTNVIEMEGEGRVAEVSFRQGDWAISGVMNERGNALIFGDRYGAEGALEEENQLLSLEGLGRIEALWPHKGFSITRDTPSSLKIDVKENSSGEDFKFIILLQSGEEEKEIRVEQKKSQGYQFEEISYSLQAGDGDSLFISKGNTYSFNIQTSFPFSFYPYGGIDAGRRAHFESKAPDAFVWLENDSVMVETPQLYEDEVYLSGEKNLYSQSITTDTFVFEGQTETVTLPAGESEFFTEVEYRRRQLTYTLHLINNRTKEKKSIEGKWIETAPTGQYTVNWKEQPE